MPPAAISFLESEVVRPRRLYHALQTPYVERDTAATRHAAKSFLLVSPQGGVYTEHVAIELSTSSPLTGGSSNVARGVKADNAVKLDGCLYGMSSQETLLESCLWFSDNRIGSIDGPGGPPKRDSRRAS